MTDGSNPTFFVTKRVSTTSKSLSPSISGPYERTVGTEQPLSLDGSLSTDPDNSIDQPDFSWTCQRVSHRISPRTCMYITHFM